MKKIGENKKGLSTIIATLLILLLIMIAIGIIWIVIRKVIVEGSEQISLGKFTLDLEIKSVVLDTGTNSVTVKVKRNPGAGEMSGLKFIVDGGETTKVIEKNGSMSELQERTFILSATELGAIVVANIQKIEIAPVFTMSSGKKVAGPVKDEYIVSKGEITPPVGCSSDGECNDNNVCTTDTCPSGTCVRTPICISDGQCCSGCSNDPDCAECSSPSQCGQDSTENICLSGDVYTRTITWTCDGTCHQNVNDVLYDDCDDTNSCTTDSCSNAQCVNTLICSSDGQCCSACSSDPDCGTPDWKQYLVARWRFEPGAITTDSKGTNTLTDMNSVHSSTTDKKEGAQSVVFERYEPQEALQISNTNLNSNFPLKSGGTGTFTICTWAKKEGAIDSGYIFSKDGSWGGTPHTVVLSISSEKLYFGIGYNNGNSFEEVSHGTALQATRWYHICVTHNAATKAYRIRVWDATAGAILGTDKIGTFTNSIYIGTQPFYVSGAPGVSWGWHGPMDEFAVFNAVLTEEQMNQVRQGALSS